MRYKSTINKNGQYYRSDVSLTTQKQYAQSATEEYF